MAFGVFVAANRLLARCICIRFCAGSVDNEFVVAAADAPNECTSDPNGPRKPLLGRGVVLVRNLLVAEALEDKAAAALGLKIGDTITVSVLGVDVPARIAVLRKID